MLRWRSGSAGLRVVLPQGAQTQACVSAAARRQLAHHVMDILTHGDEARQQAHGRDVCADIIS